MNGETDYERRLSDVKCIELGEKIGFKKGYEQAKKEFERPHGEWKYHKYDRDFECSSCNTRYDIDLPVKTWDYCPNCGASMSANDRQVTGKLIRRNLDGVYFRVERNGKWENICFSDLTIEERDSVGADKSESWWKSMAYHLADCLRSLGDEQDIVKEDDVE